MELREDKGSVKIRELDSGNSNVLNNSTDSSRAIEILHSCSTLLSFVCFLLPVSLAFSRFCHFARPTSWKPSALWNTRFFWDLRVNYFTTKLLVVYFPSSDWLSYPRTQLKAFVRRVCLQSKTFFLALFSQINFFTWSRHFEELWLEGSLFDCPQIWTVDRLTSKTLRGEKK